MTKNSVEKDGFHFGSPIRREIEPSDVLELELVVLKNHTSNYSKSDLEDTIKNVKAHFQNFLICRKKLVLLLGYAFEKSLSRKEDICEEIKNALSEEITSTLISRRDIERYCLDEWKKRTKPNKTKENDKLSFSKSIVKASSLVSQTVDQNNRIDFDESLPDSDRDQHDSPQDYEGKNNHRSLGCIAGPTYSCLECKLKESRIADLRAEIADKTALIFSYSPCESSCSWSSLSASTFSLSIKVRMQ